MKKRLWQTAILCALLLGLLCVNAGAAGGSCGDGVTWDLTEDTLTISGNGAMTNYSYIYSTSYCGVNSPWYSSSTSIKTVVINDGVNSIGNSAFYGCSGLTRVTIPDSVTSIGDSAFRECSGLTSVTIPDSVTSIGRAAFLDCSGLTSVTIPDSVTSIWGYAFRGCSGLTSVTIPDSVISIGDGAFYDCSRLASVTLPDSVIGIAYGAFYGTSIYNNNSNWENDVLYVGNHLIEAKSTLNGSYEIREGTIGIANSAFSGCTWLTSVTIPDSVTSIGNAAFNGTSIYHNDSNWENDVLYIGNHLIQAKSTLNGSYEIREGTIGIADSAFSGCTWLTSVTIPDSVTSIGNGAFECCGLPSVTIPNSVTSIGSSAFYGCFGLTSVTIPDSVTSIGHYAFSGCSRLTSVSLPVSVTRTGDSIFSGCTSLTDLTLTGTGAMSAYTDASARPWDALASSLKSVTVSSGITNVGENAFSDFTALTDVVIEPGCESIDKNAFSNAAMLTRLTIPVSVTKIMDAAFTGCTELTDVYYGGSEEEWNALRVYDGNRALLYANIHYNSVPDTPDDPDNPDPQEQDETAYTARAYELILGREADEAGLADWVAKLKSGTSAGEIIKEFFRSAEYQNRGLSSEETVSLCYQAMLGREPDESEIANWAALLNDGYSTTKLVSEFVASDEFKAICETYGLTAGEITLDARDQNSNITRFVNRCYNLALGRPADEAGLNEWCEHLLTQDLTPERVAFGFVFSNEAKGRGLDDEEFIAMLYRMMLDREPDADGLANWVNALQQNTAAEIAYDQAFGTGRSEADAIDQTRQNIYATFAQSAEFALMCNNFGF